MAVVNSNGDGPVAEDNSGTMGLAKEVENESSSNQKDTIVDKDCTDGKIETSNSIDQPEDKEETSKEHSSSTHDVQSASQPKKVTFEESTEREPVEEFRTGNDFTASENVEEKAVATSPDGRFLKFDVEIGRGSFKTVYKALDTETGVAVAWCELLPNFPQDKKGKAEQFRFKEEAKMLKTLQHPNILRFYDSWEAPCKGSARVDGRPERKMLILITELMTSGTLKGYLRRFKDVKARIIRSWGRQILKGLNYLHSRTPPIIHRDLKCDNIFINGTTGMVKIGDLGLATLKRSHVKTVIGTPEFMAPEMYDEHYDESVDVYAFGMCLLEMTTLQYPYMECTNPAQIYKRVTQGKKPNAMEKVKDPTIREIIVGCIREAKENRFTVKTLLAHPFFLPELEGIEIKAATSNTSDDEVQLTFQVAKKVTKAQNPPQQQSHDTYERPFNLLSDQPQNIAQEMAKLNVIRDTEVEAMTKLIQTKVNEAKRPRTASEANAPSTIQQSMPIVDQDMTSTNHEKYDHPVTPAIEDDKTMSDSTQAITVDATTTDNTSNKSSPHATTDKVQQLLDGAGSSNTNNKVTENGEKKNLPSPEAAVASISLLPNSGTAQANSPSHKVKELVQHSRESSSDMSQTSDSQPSVPKEQDPVVTASTNGEPKKQKSRDLDRDTDEQQPETLSQDSTTQETSKGDVPAKPPAQQQKKTRPKAVSKSTKERRPLKLTITNIIDDLVSCTLSSGGQTISFKFRLDADSSEEIAQGMVSANHLNENQKEEFKEYAEQMMKMAKQNEVGGTVGGSSTNLQSSDHKNVAILQKDGDEKTANNVVVEPPLLERSENGGHKQLEKTESNSKISPTTVGGETTQLEATTSRVNIGSQTSVESQPDKSPPPSPVSSSSVVKISVDSEQCSVQQELCVTSEYNSFSFPNTTSTATTTTTTIDVQSSEPTSTSSTTVPLTLPPITATPLSVPTATDPTTPASLVMTAAPPIATAAPPVATTPGVVTQNTRKFVVETVHEDSGDEEPIVNDETIAPKIDDIPSGQDERRDSGDSDTMPGGDDASVLHVNGDKAMMPNDDKAVMTDDKMTNTGSQMPFQQHTPPTTSPYPESSRGEPPIVEHLSSLSESFSVLMYSVLQVLRNPAMESFIKDLDNKYGNGSGPVVHECSQDVEYQNLKMKFEEEQRELKEQQRRRMEDFMQRRRRSATASPVGIHRPSAINTNRTKQQHTYHPDLSSYTSHPQQQQHNVAWPTPEGENMERKVKEALMTELGTKNKPSGKNESRSFHRVAPPSEGSHRTLSKSSTTLPQLPSHNIPLQQVYRAPSVSNWPGDDFHSGSAPNLEVNHEPLNFQNPDVSEFDPLPYETKNK